MTADALENIYLQTMVIRNITNNLDDLANAMAILGLNSSVNIGNMVIELDGVIGKIDQAIGEIANEQFKTAGQSSVNVLNAALAGVKMNERNG